MSPVPDRLACQIVATGKARNGSERWWCRAHACNATGPKGARLEKCERADEAKPAQKRLKINPADFPGGIALWPALGPVLDTKGGGDQRGIHVHARLKVGDEHKAIDETFDVVSLVCKPDLFGAREVEIDTEAAISYYFTRFTNQRMTYITCSHCARPHLDAGLFAVRAHSKHECQHCGRHFRDNEEAVSNPITLARELLGATENTRRLVRATEAINVDLSEYNGGIQLWASNPAILWTADRPENEGIHVHLFKGPRGAPEPDETYDKVTINGTLIVEQHVKYLMAQQSILKDRGQIQSLRCIACNHPHFDTGNLAFEPHSEHRCENCKTTFRTPDGGRRAVSNPVKELFDEIERSEKKEKTGR